MQLIQTVFTKDIEHINLSTENMSTVINTLSKNVEMINIDSEESMTQASSLLLDCNKVIKDLDSLQKEVLSPYKDHVKQLTSLFKPFLDSLDKMKTSLADKIKKGHNLILKQREEEARKKREEELAIIEKEKERQSLIATLTEDDTKLKQIEKTEVKLSSQPIKIETNMSAQDKKVFIKSHWTYTLLNENEVPKEFTCPDHNKIMKAIREGVRQIPGITIFDDGVVSSR